MPKSAALNELEKAQHLLLSEIYYSSLGGIGESRFTKALRTDSGIAYFPWSQFNLDYLYPNTNVGLWKMGFQAQNNRVFEGLRVMYDTWNNVVGTYNLAKIADELNVAPDIKLVLVISVVSVSDSTTSLQSSFIHPVLKVVVILLTRPLEGESVS